MKTVFWIERKDILHALSSWNWVLAQFLSTCYRVYSGKQIRKISKQPVFIAWWRTLEQLSNVNVLKITLNRAVYIPKTDNLPICYIFLAKKGRLLKNSFFLFRIVQKPNHRNGRHIFMSNLKLLVGMPIFYKRFWVVQYMLSRILKKNLWYRFSRRILSKVFSRLGRK